ncbi:hypothetical protein HYT26_04680 [Candidatus Pacearchaeota archaeon]|nr:hypothetical protein [Candidatus Pacearchaeota archaeon]
MREKYKATGRKEAKGKRGAAHIEMILSFVLFISFLIFVFAFINPAKRIEPSKALLEIVNYEIDKNSSIDITTISIKLNHTPAALCFKINLLELGILGIIGSNKTIVKDADDSRVMSGKSGDNLDIETSGDFYRIFASESFDNILYSLSDCINFPKENITIGQTSAKKAISFSRLAAFNSSYAQDYNAARQSIKFPAGNDFGFVLKDNSKNAIINALKNKPNTAVVISKEEPINLVYDNGTIITAVLNTQVW